MTFRVGDEVILARLHNGVDTLGIPFGEFGQRFFVRNDNGREVWLVRYRTDAGMLYWCNSSMLDPVTYSPFDAAVRAYINRELNHA